MEIGVFSFGETRVDTTTGRQLEAGERLRRLVEEIELADQVGLDVFGIGEHHRPDYAVTAPAIVLAAGAARTSRIRLTPTVSVLGSDDPVRVFQDYATLDQLSGGRAEIMVGRGSFIESFPLFGQELDEYEALFSEKLDLLLELRDLEGERISWQGRHRPSIADRGVYPRPAQERLPVWVAVGGTPASAVRAGRLGLPMAVAIIGGRWERFGPLVDLYRKAASEAGHDRATLPLSINGHGFVADDAVRARRLALPAMAGTMSRIGRERGWPPVSAPQLEAETRPEGALYVGDPEVVAEKILRQHALFGHQRTLIQLTVGPLPHAEVLRAIELLGTEVAPLVRREIAAS
jgi:probable LLM family oxidoreductase